MSDETKSNLKAGFVGALLLGVAIWGFRALSQAGQSEKKSVSGIKKKKRK